MRGSLFEQLQQREKEEFGENDFPISSNIKNSLIPVADTLLGRVPAYMPEYTLHDIQHCETILANIKNILPDDIELNIVELTILIQAVYLHDIGMVINREEAKKIKESQSFKQLFIEFEKDTEEDEILTEYIRRNHVNKSLEYIDLFKHDYTTYKIDFTFKGIDLSPWVKNVILSHAHSVDFLKDQERYPTKKLIHGYYVNIQFLGLLLRLGDILDFDIFRTPPFLYKHINPQNQISIIEWQKHQSIEGALFTPNEIVFDAFCKSAKVERAIREFIKWIEVERRDTMDIINSNNDTYKLQLKDEVKFICRNDGSYIYNDLELQLDYEKVLNILMGTELYDSPDIFIREILQNAYDACKCRADVYEKFGEEYIPKIALKYSSDDNILEIEDNGIGIDKEVFENYLIRIGRSYYKSKSFQSQNFRFSPISNFGIGIISCFMVSDSIEIESMKCYTPTEKASPINYVLNINNKFIEQRPKARNRFGTIIRLKLRKDYVNKLRVNSVLNIIKENMTCQEIPITIELDENRFSLEDKKIVVPEEYKDINGTLIFELNEFDWIHGYIVIYMGQHQSIFTGNKISQQCFTITNKSSGIDLSPRWLRFSKVALNIMPPHKLQLKANRNKIHEDENLKYLKNFIIEYLITKFEAIGNESLWLHHLDDGRGSVLSGNKKEFDFLANRIPFNFLLSDGVKRKNFKNLAVHLKGKRLAVIHQDYFTAENILKRWGFIFKKYDFILIQDRFTEYFYQFAAPYLQKHIIYVSKISGLIIYELLFQKDFDAKIEDYSLNYSWNRDYPIFYEEKHDSLFCVIGNNQYNSIDLQINNNHRLGKLLKETEQVSYTKRFTGSFKTNISLALERGQQLSNYVNYDGDAHFFMNNQNAFSLKSIGLINNSFISSLNSSISKDLLLPLQRDGHLLDEDLSSYLLSERDFPEWWLSKEN